MNMRNRAFQSGWTLRVMLLLVAVSATLIVVAKKKPRAKSVQPVITTTLSENDAKRFRYFYLEAVRQQHKDNYAASFDLLRHCLDINPSAPEAYFALSSYYSEMHDDSTMLACMEKAAQLSPENVTYLERLGQVLIKTHDYSKATEVYEQLAATSPARTDVLGILLQLYQHADNYDKVIATLDRIETMEGSSEDLTLSKMQVYAMQGDKKKEIKELRNLARQHPNDYKYRVMIGNWLLQNGKEKEALSEYNNVLKKEPDNIMAQMSLLDYYKAQHQDSLARAQAEQLLLSPNTEQESKVLLLRQLISDNEEQGGDSTEILGIFRKILRQPQENASMAELCAAYMSLKNMPEDSVNAVYEKVIDIEPDNVGARLQLLQSAWKKSDYDRIVALSKPGVEYHPDNIWFYYFLGLAYAQKDESELELNILRKGVEQANEESSKDIVSDFYAMIGDLLHEKGQNEEAYAAYDSCLQWKPDNIGCLNNYAYFLSEEGRELPKAEQMSYRTVKSEPGNATYLDTYAWILFKQQRFEEARIYIDQAVAADSAQSAVIIEHAGDIYMMSGDTAKALEYWQKALELDEEENALLQRKIKLKKYIEEEKKTK